MIRVGLTGSIGMGKSTTAAMFAQEGAPVFDSDRAVHEIYARPETVEAIGRAFPGAVRDGAIDRNALAALVLNDSGRLARLEAIIHPLVWAARDVFLRAAEARGVDFVVLDIPLLFETGREKEVDVVVVVTAAPDIQRRRVLARPSMSEEKLDAILAKQVPDAEKQKRADFVIRTDRGMAAAREDVARVMAKLRAGELKERCAKS